MNGHRCISIKLLFMNTEIWMHYFLKNIYLFIYFWLHRVLVVARGLLCSCGTQAPEQVGSLVATPGLSCPMACGILVPRPGTEPTFPALEGGFLTTRPPGKFRMYYFLCHILFFLKIKKSFFKILHNCYNSIKKKPHM